MQHGGTEEVEFATECDAQMMEFLLRGHPSHDKGIMYWRHPRYICTVNSDGIVIHGRGFGRGVVYTPKHTPTPIEGPMTVEEAMACPVVGKPANPEFFTEEFPGAGVPMILTVWDHGRLRDTAVYVHRGPHGRLLNRVLDVYYNWFGKGMHQVGVNYGGYAVSLPHAWMNRVSLVRRFTVEDAVWFKEHWRPEYRHSYTFQQWMDVEERGGDEAIKAVFREAGF